MSPTTTETRPEGDVAVPEAEAPAPAAPIPTKPKAPVLTVDSKVLVKAAASAARAAASATQFRPLSWLRIESNQSKLTIAGYNGEFSITTTVPVSGRRKSLTWVPADLFVERVRNAPGDTVELTITPTSVAMSSGTWTANVPAAPFDEGWTAPAVPADVDAVECGRVMLASRIGEVLHATSTDGERPKLENVSYDADDGPARLWASDSYRVAVTTAPDGYPARTFHRDLLTELARLAGVADAPDTVEVRTGDELVSFGFGATTLTGLPAEAPDLPWRNHVGNPLAAPIQARIDRERLAAAVKAVKVSKSEQAVKLQFTRTDGGAQVLAALSDESYGDANEPVSCELDGDDIVVGFNPTFLGEALGAFADSIIHMSMTDQMKVVAFHGGNPGDHVEVLMPVRPPAHLL